MHYFGDKLYWFIVWHTAAYTYTALFEVCVFLLFCGTRKSVMSSSWTSNITLFLSLFLFVYTTYVFIVLSVRIRSFNDLESMKGGVLIDVHVSEKHNNTVPTVATESISIIWFVRHGIWLSVMHVITWKIMNVFLIFKDITTSWSTVTKKQWQRTAQSKTASNLFLEDDGNCESIYDLVGYLNHQWTS